MVGCRKTAPSARLCSPRCQDISVPVSFPLYFHAFLSKWNEILFTCSLKISAGIFFFLYTLIYLNILSNTRKNMHHKAKHYIQNNSILIDLSTEAFSEHILLTSSRCSNLHDDCAGVNPLLFSFVWLKSRAHLLRVSSLQPSTSDMHLKFGGAWVYAAPWNGPTLVQQIG